MLKQCDMSAVRDPYTDLGVSSIAWERITASLRNWLHLWHLAQFSFVPKIRSVGILEQQGEVIMQPLSVLVLQIFAPCRCAGCIPEGLGWR